MKQYSDEVIKLRDKVIRGNAKLNEAWKLICEIDHQSERWKVEMGRWYDASKELNLHCDNLKGMGFYECLYLNGEGKKTQKCLPDSLGCLVCPSDRKWWEEELMALPSPKA